MSMKRFAVAALAASALFACLGRVQDNQPTDQTTNPLDCTSSERFFNGSCRPVCTTTTDCSGGTRCMAIDATDAVCLDYTSCSYLASDTQCLGTGIFYVYGRFGLEAVPYASTPWDANPYDTTPYVDPYFDPSFGGATPYATSPAGNGCEGDAQFVKIAATGDVACGVTHGIDRCRQVGDSCILLPGTTVDLVSP